MLAYPPVDPLTGLAVPDEAARLAGLHTRLAERAAADGLLDVRTTVLDSPVGPLLLAATERGIVRIAFLPERFEAVTAELAHRIGPRILAVPAGADPRLDTARRELAEYFAGRRAAFDLPLDLRLAHGFRARVLTALTGIPCGQTRSYGRIAADLGNPGASRAVGTACATNPLPIVIPCHRVVRSDGSLGGFLGGPAAKSLLLDIEARMSA